MDAINKAQPCLEGREIKCQLRLGLRWTSGSGLQTSPCCSPIGNHTIGGAHIRTRTLGVYTRPSRPFKGWYVSLVDKEFHSLCRQGSGGKCLHMVSVEAHTHTYHLNCLKVNLTGRGEGSTGVLKQGMMKKMYILTFHAVVWRTYVAPTAHCWGSDSWGTSREVFPSVRAPSGCS